MHFVETIPTAFTYFAWNIDLHTVGPFVRGSRTRTEVLGNLESLARDLNTGNNLHHVRLFESTFIPPLPNAPRFDIVLLVDSVESICDEFDLARARHDVPAPDVVTGALNAARFGDTDRTDGAVLLNHFIGDARPRDAIDAWQSISQWYATVLGVTNSTLLEFEDGAPWVIANYVVVPGTVVHFMANQLLRPSFHNNVTRRLRRADIAARPLFARRVDFDPGRE
ncbi:hypothetical protein [Nocardia salmonicida]|uniref:hypothetical protein n=1 Tax=Nocardia salmonicida TaxID=53431 RepID=UPI00378CD97D